VLITLVKSIILGLAVVDKTDQQLLKEYFIEKSKY